MNKQTIITALLALVAMAGQAQKISWRLEGTVQNAAPNDTLTVIDNNRHEPLATLLVKDGTIIARGALPMVERKPVELLRE